MRSLYIIINLLFCFSSFIGCKLLYDEEELPNIIVIVADDMGYGDLGCYNPDSKIPTPHLDELSEDGIRFTDAHSASTIGIASRYGIMTGKYGYRSGLQTATPGNYLPALIFREPLNLASLLKRKEYGTYMVGQWSIGLGWFRKPGPVTTLDDLRPIRSDIYSDNDIDFDRKIVGGPHDLGFDVAIYTAGTSTANSPFCFIENGRIENKPTEKITADSSRPGSKGGLASPGWDPEQIDISFTGKAIQLLNTHLEEKGDQPFFLYFAPAAAHTPYYVPEFARGKSAAGPRGDLCWLVDWTVGQIVACLKENGVYDETLIIFTSDNGAEADSIFGGEKYGHDPSSLFRGYKGQIFEGGHRVPLIMSWQDKIKSGAISGEVICHTDIMATIAAITDQRMTYFDASDSYDLSRVIFDQEFQSPLREATVHQSDKDVFALRRGKWKVIYGYEAGQVVRQFTETDTIGMVFNMENDVRETNNLWLERSKLIDNFQIILDQYLFADRTAPVLTSMPEERVRLKIED